jgi:hypothetical protein
MIMPLKLLSSKIYQYFQPKHFEKSLTTWMPQDLNIVPLPLTLSPKYLYHGQRALPGSKISEAKRVQSVRLLLLPPEDTT